MTRLIFFFKVITGRRGEDEWDGRENRAGQPVKGASVKVGVRVMKA